MKMEKTDIEFVKFETKDVIATSGEYFVAWQPADTSSSIYKYKVNFFDPDGSDLCFSSYHYFAYAPTGGYDNGRFTAKYGATSLDEFDSFGFKYVYGTVAEDASRDELAVLNDWLTKYFENNDVVVPQQNY